jgi:hypothetical protein
MTARPPELNDEAEREQSTDVDWIGELRTSTSLSGINENGWPALRQSIINDRTPASQIETNWFNALNPQELTRVSSALQDIGLERQRLTPALISNVCRSMINELGAESWERREAAASVLRALGTAALPGLLATGFTHPDAQIRATSREIVGEQLNHRQPLLGLSGLIRDYDAASLNRLPNGQPNVPEEQLDELGNSIANAPFDPDPQAWSRPNARVLNLLRDLENRPGMPATAREMATLRRQIEGDPQDIRGLITHVQDNLPRITIEQASRILERCRDNPAAPDLQRAQNCLMRAFTLNPRSALTHAATSTMLTLAHRFADTNAPIPPALEALYEQSGGDMESIRGSLNKRRMLPNIPLWNGRR